MKIFKNKPVLLTLALITSFALNAQQKEQFTHFMTNQFLVNPAVSGVEDYVDIKTGYRNQWTNFQSHINNPDDGTAHNISPESKYLSIHSPIGKPHHSRTARLDDHNWIGVGAIFMDDRTFPTYRQYAYLNFSYNMELTPSIHYGRQHEDGLRLAVGANFGAQRFGVDYDYLYDYDLLVNNIPISDKTILAHKNAAYSKMLPDASVGAMIYFGNLFRVGYTTFQLFRNIISMDNIEDNDKRVYTRHHFFTASSKFQFDDTERLYVMPSILIKKTDASPPSVDMNVRLDWMDNFYGGITYRVQSALSLTSGILFDLTPDKNRNYNNHFDIEVAYSYDITINGLREYNNGGHELIVGLRIEPKLDDRNPEGTKQYNKRNNADLKRHQGANHQKIGHPGKRKQKKRKSMGH